MKKSIKVLIGVFCICALTAAFVGCSNNSVTKNINDAKEEINKKDYNKAEDDLQNAIDQDSTNKEANTLMEIVSNYQGAVTHYKDGEYMKAQKELNEIPTEYKDYAIKSDIDNLKHETAFQIDKSKDVNGYIKKAQQLIKENKYDDAENVIQMIDVNSPNKEQKNQINTMMTEISKHNDEN